MGSRDRTLEAWDERPPARSCFGYFGKLRNLEDGSEETVLLTAEEGKEAGLETAAREIEQRVSGPQTWVVPLTPAFLEADAKTGSVRILPLAKGTH